MKFYLISSILLGSMFIIVLFSKILNILNPDINIDSIEDSIIDESTYTINKI